MIKCSPRVLVSPTCRSDFPSYSLKQSGVVGIRHVFSKKSCRIAQTVLELKIFLPQTSEELQLQVCHLAYYQALMPSMTVKHGHLKEEGVHPTLPPPHSLYQAPPSVAGRLKGTAEAGLRTPTSPQSMVEELPTPLWEFTQYFAS
ncbi:hypothetical protein I79_015008 [Cricetulus griseus]|uniref:Uncharacterized protein n=1 Tax=Cricetulus griseus TaxID=10029 RepID=G3HVN1_CRIGR|nr:hypothetical protein I79_015008 [Cricetulus griseus]